MPLTSTDWIVIVGYLLVNLLIGLYYRRRASGNTEEFFISGRDVSWWLAGTSMVATTFAADTPLLVCGLVARQGIAGNWIWWGSCIGGMMTVFFFARYWRRAEVLTDVQLVELRYGGKPAAFLRGFKAVYLGLFMNCFILGWVTQAMVSIITVLLGPVIAQGRVLQLSIAGHVFQHTLGDPRYTSVLICIFILIPFTGLIHIYRRTLGRVGHRLVSVCFEDGDDYRAGLGCRGKDWRDASPADAFASDRE